MYDYIGHEMMVIDQVEGEAAQVANIERTQDCSLGTGKISIFCLTLVPKNYEILVP